MRYVLAVLFTLIPMLASAATRYIDITAGADTNTSTQAQSTSTPWKHLPCMATATSNAAAYVPVPGDIFVLKGGESWPNANFPCAWIWSGTANNRITITTDATWYTGGSWTRPIWTAGGTAISGARNSFFHVGLGSVSYVTLSGIEMTGFYWAGAGSFATCDMIQGYQGTYITLDNLYLHGWSHDTYASGGRDSNCHLIYGNTASPYMAGSILQNSVIDGSDSTGGGDSLSNYAWPSFINNVMHDFPNFALPLGDATISGNLFYNCKLSFDSVAQHSNFLETLGGPAGGFTVFIHDNVFHDSVAGCETAFLGNPGETDYVWNNVWYNLSGNPPELTQNVDPGVAVYLWNNTIVPPAGGYCLRQGHAGNYTTIVLRNNHCVSTGAIIDPAITATSLTVSTNLLQTPNAATAQGYTNAQSPYVYYPTVGGGTIATGTALTSECTGSRTSLCLDTTYGSLLTGTGVSGAGRTASARPAVNAWDIGAYQFASAFSVRAVGPASQTAATLIWPPSTLANFAGFHVYRSTTPGVYGVPLATITPATAAATHSPLTRYLARLPVAGTYYFTVVPFDNVATEGPGSSEVTVVTTGMTTRTVRP